MIRSLSLLPRVVLVVLTAVAFLVVVNQVEAFAPNADPASITPRRTSDSASRPITRTQPSNRWVKRLGRLCGASTEELQAGYCFPEIPRPPTSLNGVPLDQFVVMTEGVQLNIRAIYSRGLELGNHPRAFSKIGDSTIDYPYFLAHFDMGTYQLGEFGYLQAVIRQFAGSYNRKSVAVRKGLHAWTALNPMWADKSQCQPNETPIACEYRLNKPIIALIRLGTNDAGTTKYFDQKMRAIITTTIEMGVIPVLSTKPDVRENAQVINRVTRQLAAEYQIPLWDLDRLLQTLPDEGLGPDGVHLTFFPSHDYTRNDALRRGHALQDLSALIALDMIWRALTAK